MSFIFQMDSEDQRTSALKLSPQQVQPAAAASPSTSSPTTTTTTSGSSGAKFMVDYEPSRAAQRGIKQWLAAHGSSYLPHDQPTASSSSSSRSPNGHPRAAFALPAARDESDSESDSDAEPEDDEAIFLQPRRHLSRQASGATLPAAPAPQQSEPTTSIIRASRSHHLFRMPAPTPAKPIVDLAAASGHVDLDFGLGDKSHWSDDEESDVDDDEAQSVSDDVDDGLWALPPDELQVPALVQDDEEGNPASTSTRSISIPIPSSRRARATSRHCFDVESPPTRRRSQEKDGQSFWTPWMDQYLADSAAFNATR